MSSSTEIRVLKISALAAALCALVGLAVGWWINSMVIFFDGAYSLFSYGLSMLSVMVAAWVRSPRSQKYPMGRFMAEPMAVMLKGVMILLVVLLSALAAIKALMAGGRVVAADVAVLFGLFNVLFCALVWWYLARQKQRSHSVLIAAEKHQWAMDTLISFAVMLGFILAFAMQQSVFADWARYADPVMMLLVALFFLPVPIKMIWQAAQQLLLKGADPELQERVAESLRPLGIERFRLVLIGAHYWLQLEGSPELMRQAPSQQINAILKDLPGDWRWQWVFEPQTVLPQAEIVNP